MVKKACTFNTRLSDPHITDDTDSIRRWPAIPEDTSAERAILSFRYAAFISGFKGQTVKMQKNATNRLVTPGFPKHGQPLRLFIGVAPDRATQHFLDATCRHIERRGLPRDCHWVTHANRHLTLAFLGETEMTHLENIEQWLQEIATTSPTCFGEIVSTHPFPKTRAKLLAAELLPNPELAALQQQCNALMRSIGKHPERKSFRPHFTLARSRHGFSLSQPVATAFTCKLDNLTLYHSLLAPGGSQYTPVLSLALQDSPRSEPGNL